MQLGNLTTNTKFKIDFTLPEFSTTKIMTLKFQVDESVKGRYNKILDRDILTALVLNIKVFKHIIEACDGLLKGSTSPMIYFDMYKFKDLNPGNIPPK